MIDQAQAAATNREDTILKNGKEWTHQDEHCGVTCIKLVIWQFILMETPMNYNSDDGVGGNILSLQYRNNSYRMNMTTYG